MPEDDYEFYDDSTGEVFDMRKPSDPPEENKYSDLIITDLELLILSFTAPLECMLHRSRI